MPRSSARASRSIFAAHDRLVIPATVEKAIEFDIAPRQDHIGDDHSAPEGDDANTRPQIVLRPSALRKNQQLVAPLPDAPNIPYGHALAAALLIDVPGDVREVGPRRGPEEEPRHGPSTTGRVPHTTLRSRRRPRRREGSAVGR